MNEDMADRLLWVTNIPTPYREPLWGALAELGPLTVAFLAENEPNRQWTIDLREKPYSVVQLHARPIATSGDSAIYAPSMKLLALLRRRPRAVVLDGWESPAFMTARLVAHRLQVPVMASYRSTLSTHRYVSGLVPALRRWFFRGSDVVLTAGSASTDAVLEMGVPRPRVVEGFNTVDVERFNAGARTARAALPSRPGHHFLYVGQFIPRKNVDSLITAFAAVREPDDSLTLVGTGPSGDALLRQCHELGVEQAVRFAGHLDGPRLVAAYAAANTFVLPSTEEVWGLVVNEALAAGLHVVVSDACGVAPSVQGMPGVETTAPGADSIADALRASRSAWAGPIENHPVVAHTPKALATVIHQALAERTPVRQPRGAAA